MAVLKNHQAPRNISLIKLVTTLMRFLKTVQIELNKILKMGLKAVSYYLDQKVPLQHILETTKKYILANIISKLKDCILDKLSQSEQEIELFFIKASPDPQKKLELTAHTKYEVEQALDKIIQMAQKSPKKAEVKKKAQPKPKVRYLKLVQGELYLEIITTSFTNFSLRDSQTVTQALNNIAYSRLPNSLQPIDIWRQFILVLNPIVSLYEECKNTLSIINCKKTQTTNGDHYESQYKNMSPIKE